MKAVERHLYIRGKSFYYRSPLPRQLHDLLSMREIVIALGTQDLSEARVRVARIDYDISKSIQNLTTDLKSAKDTSEVTQAVTDFEAEIEEAKSNYSSINKANLNKLQVLKAGKSAKPAFSQIMRTYLKDCQSDAPNTRLQKEKSYELFIDLIGDKPFTDIDIADARAFKFALMKIPPNAKKKLGIDSFQGVDLDNIAAKYKPQHPKTVNNRLAYLNALFGWAIRFGYYTGENPFSNVMIKNSHSVSSQRQPFKNQELKRLFQCPIYTGCASPQFPERLQSGEHVIKDSLYWIPMIGLLSGMRLNEICQLYLDDIQEENGIPVFDINDDAKDKMLKNTSSKRKIPIHNKLNEDGLHDHIANLRKNGETRLFPDISMGSDKSYASVFSKRFRRVMQEMELKRDGLCFHSFRHTFIDCLRQAGVERAIAMAITGHQSNRDVHDSYGHGYPMDILQESIHKAHFPGID